MRGKRGFKGARLAWIIPLGLMLAATAAFLAYASVYYRADPHALDMLESDGDVQVSRTDYGWRFDGPGEEAALVFYPGAKVEETAYAPLLHGLAREGVDACLVKMPLRFAFLGIDSADAVMKRHDYARWIIGGHSLGGSMAVEYAARHPDRVDGVVLLGSYGQKALDESVFELSVYGTEDGLATRRDIEKNRAIAPPRYYEHAIQGGNHAQFGNYGIQSGDGAASVSAGDQQAETIRAILDALAEAGAT